MIEVIEDSKKIEWENCLIIAVDFDNTLTVENKFPDIGNENSKAFEVLKKWQKEGIKIVLHTMRGQESLSNALDWCKERGFIFDAIGTHPYQDEILGYKVPKCFAHFYIDDRNIGVPLREENKSLCVDWDKIDEMWGEFIINVHNHKKN